MGEKELEAKKTNKKRSNLSIILACFLGWLLPGAGHLYLGKKGRAIAFFLCIYFLFFLGLVVDGHLYTFEKGRFLRNLATLADLGVGPTYFIGKFSGLEKANVLSYTYDYGTVFIIIAGLLNILIIFDVFDIAMGRKS